MQQRRTARHGILVAVTIGCLAVLPLAGCGKPPAPGATTPGASAGADGPGTIPSSSPTRADPVAAPTDPPTGDKFTFDQAARYDDGVLVEIATIAKAVTNPQQHGAEGTEGSMVVAEILVTNQSSQPYDTSAITVWGYYDDVGAPKIVDETKQLGDSFSGVVQPGAQAKATMGFAIPADQLQNVTIMIDGGAADKGPVQFSGPVQ
ncbi:hypothetical protein [Enemella evansiae]|uniref:hypothetical protein n=1 Tax=Enemella evansiae TaxID=2016499 RepID=UPI000B96C634|nr:hypothetical protein [Enemella evansiae]OYN96778.1 hypothetical protein CGZ96_10765 [Enemella evansiae]OYO00824.1 hypothetical protein CGZ95_09420 [Enemella evansiae]PFG69193.1 hypothetical protein B0O41_4046 [Propionibacteriaceae bacterium ES.041]TDO89462.1 hypothetical protein C8D81_2334 [Enemella evansiae]